MIVGFIHIARMGSWRAVLADMIRDIEASGILNVSGAVYGYVYGPPEDYPYPTWLKVIDKGPDLTLGENPTMQRLSRFAARNPGAKVWYVHTKGASYDEPSAFVTAWRRYMSRYVLDGHQACAAALNTHDVAGVEWWQTRTPEEQAEHVRVWGWPSGGDGAFAGNFWWARCDYLASLPADKVDLMSTRWGAEWKYVGTRPDVRVKCFAYSGKNLYHHLPDRTTG